uniref:peroxidase n=1 Tax=Oryza brachyantha TaxID=4533 RepID=J3LK36_ORYBR
MDARLPLPPLLLLLLLAAVASAELSPEFYSSTCPEAEKIVSGVIERKFKEDPGTSALLLRLLFHDCFANGCDASILIDPLSNQSAEKEAGPNVSVRGYDIIDEVKTAVEKACPGVVSCADIMSLSARDAVRLAGGPDYVVPTGRRDSLVSNREDADGLPGPDIAIPKLIAEFSEKGFSMEELVVLLAGGHTIGKAKCFFIEVDAAPIDPAYRSNITSFCDGKEGDKGAVPLDPITPDIVDPNYFGLVMAKKMPLTVDRLMGLDPRTAPVIKDMEAKPKDFAPLFAKAMEKLSVLKVITGKDGEIRKSCSEFNNPVTTDDGPSVIRISSLNPEEMIGSMPAATGKVKSESRKMAAGGAMEERMKAAMKPPGDIKLESNEATSSVPAMAFNANQAAGGVDTNNVAGNEAEAEEKKSKKKKKKKKKASAEATVEAPGSEASKEEKAIGGQSFSIAGAGNKGIGGEASKAEAIGGQSFSMAGTGAGEATKKAKAMGGQSFSMAGVDAEVKTKAMKSQSFSMAGTGQDANKGTGGEEAKKRPQPKLRGGQQL